MRLGLPVLSLLLVVTVVSSAQSLRLKPTPQYVTMVNGVSGTVTAGARLTLWVDVTPVPGKRIYAAGNKEFMPVALVMTPNGAVAAGTPAYPAAELDANSGGVTPVPVYRRTFRIRQPVVVGTAVKKGETLTVAAALNYQACDDALCYPSASLPILWSLTAQ